MNTIFYKLNDKDFLEKFISIFTTLENILPTNVFIIKDIDSVHRYISPNFVQRTGKKVKDLLGLKNLASIFNDKLITQIVDKEDQIIIKNRQTINVLKIYGLIDGIFPYICIKSPIINPDTNNVVGILCQNMEANAADLSLFITQIYNKSNRKDKMENLPKLSKREKEVIFFFMSNFNSQEIADLISRMNNKTLTKSTIDNLFVYQLYPKFNVHNRPALYEKLVQAGYSNFIPKSLLSINSVILNNISIY